MKTQKKSVLLLCTSRCNSKCLMCHHGNGGGIDLPLPVIRRLSQQLRDAGFTTVYLSGGEPLLRADFAELVGCITDEGLDVRLSTNGTRIDSKNVQTLKKISSISISLDGMSEIHDAIRGFSGAFDRTVRGIKTCREFLPQSHICISITMLPKNIDFLDNVIEYAFSIGADSIGVQPPVPSFFSCAEDRVQCNNEEFKKKCIAVFDRLMILAHSSQSQFDNTYSYYQLAQDWISNHYQVIPDRCGAGRDIITIFPDGCVGPCWALKGPNSINEDNLQSVLNGLEFSVLAKKANLANCSQCLFYCFFFQPV